MLKEILKLIRVDHWVKNLFIFVPLVFAQKIFDMNLLLQSLLAFFSFSFASAIVYIFNDMNDIEADRLHPKKRFRPLVTGAITKNQAFILIFVLLLIIVLFLILLNIEFVEIVILYFIINVLYTFYLKHFVILDLFSIASGFMLRVIGGATVIEVDISNWLILTTLFISLFLAIMKRRSELISDKTNGKTRKVLEEYSLYFIDQISSISAAGVILCYALYTVSERTVNQFGTEKLVITTLFVVFGIFRYMYLGFNKSKGEDTAEILRTDKPMIINIILYIIVSIIIIYT